MTEHGKAFRLDGKAALVSGAARGIGAAIAEALARAGASVLVSDVLEQPGQETVERIRRAGGAAAFCKHDVTDEAQWQAAIAAAEKTFGPLEVLVNNAGIETAALLSQCEVSDFRRVMEVNVTGVFLGLKHAVRAMSPGGSSGRSGAIVNLSSVAGLVGTTGHIAYHTSKGAVRLMTKAAAVECAQLGTGIRVNSVHPAIVNTEMGVNFIQHFVDLKLAPDYATAEAAIKAAHLLGGFGETADVANAVLYLASPASKWVTGTELVLDGGYTAA
ncbi:MAG: glucose 1-dehydrogenase [Nevskia sp.]|nr:glucose 1-dehydrogenase [Nevskia sp.]